MSFNPFENRQSRDVRNDLASGLIKAIQSRSITVFSNIEISYLTNEPPNYIIEYILHRKNCLENILNQLNAMEALQKTDAIIPILLWNQGLFFEFHEWIEHLWLKESGDRKKALRALILAAVVYEQLAYSRIVPAKKLAKKAILIFKQQADQLPEWADNALFIKKLTKLNLGPPILEIINHTNEWKLR